MCEEAGPRRARNTKKGKETWLFKFLLLKATEPRYFHA